METARWARPSGLALAALAACVGLLATACGGPTGPPNGAATNSAPVDSGAQSGKPGSATLPYVPADSLDTVEKRLGVTLGGKTTYIKNGGHVVFDDGLVAEIYLDPYPPAAMSSTIDVYLTRDGQALVDGGVEIAYDMLAMAHGPFSAEAKAIGGGHYLVGLDYIMFGPWEQVITLRIGLQRIHLPILVVAYP